MHPLRVVVGLHLLYKIVCLRLVVFFSLLVHVSPALSQNSSNANILPQMSPAYPPGFLARIDQNSPADVEKALLRAEELYFSLPDPLAIPPLAFVIHGPEVRIFLRENYQEFKNINDLAARLSALGVINLRVCEARLKSIDQKKSALFPFVGTVKIGVVEEKKLIKKDKYQYF